MESYTHGPSSAERAYLKEGLGKPSGKLPLFDPSGRRISTKMVHSCLDKGYAEPWFANPMKPDWLVCRLTRTGRQVLGR